MITILMDTALFLVNAAISLMFFTESQPVLGVMWGIAAGMWAFTTFLAFRMWRRYG